MGGAIPWGNHLIDLLSLAIELDPDRPYAHETLGRVYEARGMLGEAEQSFREALRKAEQGGFPDLGRFADHLERVRR